MNDRQIRSALKRELLAQYEGDPETLILNELGVRHGAARIDLVVVNGMVHGFEVKSDDDTLRRLPRQASMYNSVLDRVTLVVGYRHLNEALEMIPVWWGVKLAQVGADGQIRFSDARLPTDNPSPDKLGVAKLLWRAEALALLEELSAAEGVRSKPRAAVYARLVEVANMDLLRARVRWQIRCRTNWRSGELQMSSDD